MGSVGVLRTPFGEDSTADEVAAGIDWSRRRAVVTGASSGIGVETARVLADHGAAVTLAVRDTDAGESVAVGIRASTGNDAIDVRHLELADPESVASFVGDWDGPLDVLINNAGVMAIPERTLTADEIELHFATNHLGHFSLATGLHGALRASGSARVVSLSSSAHLYCPVLFDDPTFAFVPYSPFLGYGQSKTANALFAVEANRRWQRDGVAVNAVMPSGIATRLQRHVDPDELARARREAGASAELKTVEQGAATTILAAMSPLLDGVGGRYLEDCNQAEMVTSRAGSDGRHGVAGYALDEGNAERLWDMSEQLVHAAR
ncbi:MAG TPA: SDR family NAD(P)-dependent oxidoreductase [Solirubrobacteraceae bacterium]|jgi:NAD(P)-dependent dehydrogenase (short-subunit alcohol dehydrogenase family)|nr:SDR family NAD(P)-dependent oxidoreductase [Solirubrobacteraceae bacterium]